MAIITDPLKLQQGSLTTSTTAGFSGKSGDTITIGGTADLPALDAGMYFEVRDAPTAANNGLYVESGGSPTTSSITADKVDGVPPENDAGPDTIRFFGHNSTAADEKVMHYDTNARKWWIVRQGEVIAADGVDGNAIYRAKKTAWKDDNDLNKHPFPTFTIDSDPAGKYLFGTDGVNFNGWGPENTANNTRELIRNAGFTEFNGEGYLGTSADGTTEKIYSGIGSIGPAWEDEATDKAYYVVGNDPTDTGARNNFVFPGPVNEVVLTYLNVTPADTGTGFAFTTQNTLSRNDGGNWATDGYKVGSYITIENAEDSGNNGTFGPLLTVDNSVDGDVTVGGTPWTNNAADTTLTAAYDHRQAFAVFLRVRDGDPNGKTFAKDDLAGISRTTVGGYVTKFGLTDATDLKIAETDANIAANSPYTRIWTRYLAADFNMAIDSAALRAFGIVVDVGNYSQSQGVSNGTTTFTSADWTPGSGENLADYAGGTLILHDATAPDRTSHTISGTPTAPGGTLTIVLTGALTNTESNLSFTMERATPLTATSQEIYEKLQYDRRQAANVNSAVAPAVAGDTSDVLAFFEGDTLRYGNTPPVNPNGGGSGVVVVGFDPNNTNSLSVKDNVTTQYTFPFVAAGNLIFSQTLIDDGADLYQAYFRYTERFTNTGFGLSSASGATATLDSSTTDLVAELSNGDYIRLGDDEGSGGFAATEDNGLYVLTGAPAGSGPWTATVRKLDGQTITNESAGASVSLDKNPLNTPDAIIVDDNGGADISGVITASPVAFTFDYDGNVQGGRTAGVDAPVAFRAIGSDTAQYVETLGVITQATGLSFTLNAPTERN